LDHIKELKFAIDAVSRACIVTSLVQTEQEKIIKHTKNDRSPVTIADYATQAYIGKALADFEPTSHLAAEEDSITLRQHENSHLIKGVQEALQPIWENASPQDILSAIDLGRHDGMSGRFWTLDPIDGTKGFLRGGQYAISMALIENGVVTCGVLGCPNLSSDLDRPFDDPDTIGNLYFASSGVNTRNLQIGEGFEDARPVRASTGIGIQEIRICESVEAAHSNFSDSAKISRYLGTQGKPARLDSQCKYAVVARGQAEAYIRSPTDRFYEEKIWDHAAGMIIAEQAGAVVSDLRGQQLDFSHGRTLKQNRGILCTSEEHHAQINDVIRKIGLR
jgi:3'(2'), 5'-bisphosphate nucleotidase